MNEHDQMQRIIPN